MNHKFIFLTAAVVPLIGIYFDFGHGLTWVEYTEPEDYLVLIMRLLFLTLIAERIIEFYNLLFRSKKSKVLLAEISKAKKAGTDNVHILEAELLEFRDVTRRQSAMVGFIIGALMAIIGIRVFTGMFDFGDASSVQIIMFDLFEVFVMGCIIAGGSKGINKIVSAIEAFAQAGKDNAIKASSVR